MNRYKQASEIRPDLVSAQWNLYLAQTEMLHFAEAEASLARARDLDNDLVATMLAEKKNAGAGQLMHEPPSLARLKEAIRGRRDPGEMSASLTGPVSVASGAALLLGLVLCRGRAASACGRCGRPWCGRCRFDASKLDLCSRCVHLFGNRDRATLLRADEMSRLQRRERASAIVRRCVSFVLPGSGLLLAGRAALGIALMVAWVLTALLVAARERLLLAPRVPVTDLPHPGIILALLLMLAVWIAGNVASTIPASTAGGDDGA
jgi:hypothetical protein